MSSDNGTYILQTYGPEFRIAHTQAIDNVYGSWNPKENVWTGDPSFILDTFGESKVFTELEEAWDTASVIDAAQEISEYGVCLITEWKEKKFSELIEASDNGTAISD